MSEDSRMDKKSYNRSTQSQSRAPTVDCKKSSELTHKPWPRNKKREGPGVPPKNEPYRKNAGPSKGRGQVDKRPRARGSSGFVMGGMEVSGIAEGEPELGSVFVPGRKKQNLNHLLNFVYSPRGVSQRDNGSSYRHSHAQYHTIHPHIEHLYLQASCQFVMKEDGDYSVNLMDPDVPIKWDQIEEIVVRSMGRSECPICLGAPVAGRVGRCGHVYCWPCALHYAASHERHPPPCPVCAAPFRVEAMKPARMLQWQPPADEVCMRLVRRLRGSTVVEVAPPRGPSGNCEVTVLPLSALEHAPYSKLFSANEQQVRDILERERKELQAQILAEIDTTEIIFIEQALNTLKLQEENIDKGNIDNATSISSASVEEEAIPPIIYQEHVVSEKKIDWFDVTAEFHSHLDASITEQVEDLALALDHSNLNPEAEEFQHGDATEDAFDFPLTDDLPIGEEKLEAQTLLTENDKENQAKYFYFYQAEDGQQVFLHSINVRMLCASWGAIVAAPPVIRARVLRRETASLTEESRKRMPCAAHLPLHCPFDIVELDLEPPAITVAAVNTFSDELQRRARTRARLERDERRRERAYRRAMEGPPRPDVTSAMHFPPANTHHIVDLPPLPSQPEMDPSPSSSGLSFAKMASTSGTWRVRAQRPLTPPPPPEENDSLSAPRALCLSDAIEAALHAAPAPITTRAKNKKTKHKVLFTTGMQRTP